MLICGASFAGLAVARELAGSGADVLLIDRYEIGERQTSACGIPTGWLEALDLMEAHRQTFGELVIHTPHTTARYGLPWTFSTFDYRTLCERLADQGRFAFETAKVDGRTGQVVHTDRGDIRAGLIVDAPRLAAGARGAGDNIQPPDALLSRGLEVHPHGAAATWRSGSTARTCPPATAGASRRAMRCGSASARSTRASTSASRPCGCATDLSAEPVRYQGNWIPHALRNATEDGVFFVGDSAGHCLPLTAEGIRTALYFGHRGRSRAAPACWRAADSRAGARATAPSRAPHARPFGWMLRCQRLIPRVAPRLLAGALRAMEPERFLDWAFGHYLEIAPPGSLAAPARARGRPRRRARGSRRRGRGAAPRARGGAAGAGGARARGGAAGRGRGWGQRGGGGGGGGGGAG